MKRNVICIFFAMALLLQGIPTVNAEQSCTDLLGVDFLDELVFFGESTTMHLRQRSQLNPNQIWTTASGTASLDSNSAHRPVIDPKDGSSTTPAELAKRDQPKWVVLSFGLNGIIGFAEAPEAYLKKYRRLMDAITEGSPDTRFLIQSIYPVADTALQRDWQFSVSPREINERIDCLNGVLKDYCNGLSNADFVDTSCNLKNADGFLRPEYTTDGIHLTEAAYREILNKIVAHRKDESS